MIKQLYSKYKHGVPMLICMIIYLIWFYILENRSVDKYYIIHVTMDDQIPFIEQFVIPYFCWFVYVFVFVIYFIISNKEDYEKVFTFLITGMILFLVISTIWPNAQELRPEIFPRNNIFTKMIADLYKTDTPTNIIPSIHVYNSLGIQFAVMNSKALRKNKAIQITSVILCILIILSTVFIKQHSLIDVIVAIVFGAVMYYVVYVKKMFFGNNKKHL